MMTLRRVLVTAAVGGLALAATAAPAGAGVVSEPDTAPLTIVKTVSGPVPAGTTFTATIECDSDIIEDDTGPNVDSATVEFDAAGQPTTPDTFSFGDPGTCTVTETEDGGAATTTYACESTVPEEPPVAAPDAEAILPIEDEEVCPAAGPQDDPITVNIVNPDQTATVTIHNTFPEPVPAPITPAAQIVAQPAFTG